MKKNSFKNTVVGLFFGLFTLLMALPVSAQLENPLGKTASGQERGLFDVYGSIVQALLGFTGVLAFVIFVIGGITLLTSAGNPEKVKKGQQMLVWAVIGVIVTFSSYIILRYVIGVVTGAAFQ